MEEHRRTEAGRVRTAREFVAQFFPWTPESAKDEVFHRIPNDVRGPILSAWGIRGAKAALRDDDERVRDVVHDAFIAGDIDDATFEEGITPEVLVDWIPLSEWWSFWRRGKLTGVATQKALATARDLGLIDDRWFLLNVQGRAGKLKGTDVLCDTLSKDQIVGWLRRIHESADGSPRGIVAAIGWDTVLAKTAQDALLFALDAFARKARLIEEAPPTARGEEIAAKQAAVSSPVDGPAAEEQDDIPDADFTVSIPDDSVPPPSAFDTAAPGPATDDESPRLAEARAQMMEALGVSVSAPAPWTDSDVPAKPSALEWPAPPPIVLTGVGSPAPMPSEDVIALDDDAVMSDRTPAAQAGSKSPPRPPPRVSSKAPSSTKR